MVEHDKRDFGAWWIRVLALITIAAVIEPVYVESKVTRAGASSVSLRAGKQGEW